MNTLTTYLTKYYKYQDKILLCYRENEGVPWTNRCFYLDEKYNSRTPYNHRSILNNEIIIEYDNKDKEENIRLTKLVRTNLDKDKVKYMVWDSGNKSIHIHILVDLKNATNIPLLKKTFIRYYCRDLPIPDLQLCSSNHLVRSEYGIHEKTGRKKELIYRHPEYPCINDIKPLIWDNYSDSRRESLARKIVNNSTEITALKGFKYLVTAHEFKEAEDGRERALFMLIHILKPQYKDKKAELISFLQDWYHYSGGYKLTPKQIENKICYHWSREYNITERYLNEFLESINRNDLIEKR